ncbi:acetate--CoA ligase [Actinotalea sp. K2]|uniref:acetate--CoA ligase n=1 Tax=Actinotalea sp. K2 TaxID=2939438 RepID=UPI002016FBDF|nr:acetate--CoA ligase [Actinotalea sp. K2]MCL3861360.1 acetate--CoA ligase [Actinotalea sp. K2]
MTDDAQSTPLESLSTASPAFPPTVEFAAQANAHAELYSWAAADRLGFWGEQARELLTWDSPFSEVLDWSGAPVARWFADGTLNACYNAVDRHVEAGNGDRVALLFEGEPGDTRRITYAELQQEVSRAANVLLDLGVRTGDRVAIYLPMIPEAVIAMLACARIGAVHSVVFGGFSAEALRSRIDDASAVLVITADGGYRRGSASALKPAVDEALGATSDALGPVDPPSGTTTTVRKVLVVRRTGQDVAWSEGRDVWWHEALAAASDQHTPVAVEAEHPLFILYTSGTTGKPKGIFHTTGGYLTQTAFTHLNVFDLKAETDVYWCTADVGWVTGHSYVVYGPLLNGATQLVYEGTPDTPHKGRWWELVARYGVTILYTAPTAIRTCMKWGEDIPAGHDLSSLRVLGSVGEPINPEAWTWYRRVIGGDRTPVVDTWWQTETGAIMISPLPGVTAAKPGSAQTPLPGIAAEVVDEEGHPVPDGASGYLVLTEPWPAMLRGIWGDEQRFRDTYWSRFADIYFAGDGARKDDDGDIWLLGRVDDVMNISGHRLSTAEIESALVSHPMVAEAAVVGASDETTGQAVVAFVILRAEWLDRVAEPAEPGTDPQPDVATTLRAHVAKEIGPIAKPRTILVVTELPKTRSGKIMRRLLRDVAEHRTVGDVTTLADSSVMDLIASGLDRPTST